jgi:hypothetical protein
MMRNLFAFFRKDHIKNSEAEKVYLFKVHPVTGTNAANMHESEKYPESDVREFRKMVKEGADFYWCKNHDEDEGRGVSGYHRVELANIAFVMDVIGKKVVIVL